MQQLQISFLPDIASPRGGGDMGNVFRTGQSFAPGMNVQTRAELMGQGRHPMRSASITTLLSPKEMVQQFTRRGSQDFGIEGYQAVKHGPPRKKSLNGMIPKNKTPGPFEQETRYRRNFPGAGAYTLKHNKTWDMQIATNKKKPNFTKSPRKT